MRRVSGDGESNMASMETGVMPDRALCVKKKWIDLILSGQKTWEIRSTATRSRRVVGLAESGSGLVVGEVRIADCLPLEPADLPQHFGKHCIADCGLVKYRKIFAWVLEDAKRYSEPKPYVHPAGAIVWVKLSPFGWAKASSDAMRQSPVVDSEGADPIREEWSRRGRRNAYFKERRATIKEKEKRAAAEKKRRADAQRQRRLDRKIKEKRKQRRADDERQRRLAKKSKE